MNWAGLLVIRDKRVLMVKEKDKTFCVFPGGTVEDGETNEETLRRELLEEIGVRPIDYKEYLSVDLEGRVEGTLIHFTVYKGEIADEIKSHGETEGIVWLNSNFKEEGFDVGHLAAKAVLPKLKSEGLIS